MNTTPPPPFSNLSESDTDSLPSLRILSNCDDTTVDHIMVKYEDNNMTSGTGNFISGTDIASEITEFPVDDPEEEGDPEYE